MPQIKFNKATNFSGVTGYLPAPSSKAMPNWYRKMSKHLSDDKAPDRNGNIPLTVKACPPFLDSMISGYTIFTEYDLHFSIVDEKHLIQWKAGNELIELHGEKQLAEEQIPSGFSNQPLKFNNLWQIKTPKGYSTAFMHPVNRTDLPFFTIAGIVETDTYKNIINFPFLIRSDFKGTLPAGTPIVQLFPFKRERWNMQIGDADQREIEKAKLQLNHKLIGSYKAQWWQRKEYR